MPPETWLLQAQAQHLLLLPWLGRNTPVLPVPLADTGHISLPTSSQIPQIPLFWGFSSKFLPRLGALSGALANLTAPLCSYLYPQHHPPTAHSHGQTGRQASLLLLAPPFTDRIRRNISSPCCAGACLAFSFWTSIWCSHSPPRYTSHCWNCMYYFGFAWQAKDSRKFVVLLVYTTLHT